MLDTRVFRGDLSGDITSQLMSFLDRHESDPELMVIVVYRNDATLANKPFITPDQTDVLRDQWPGR
jgi:hypothetical protein